MAATSAGQTTSLLGLLLALGEELLILLLGLDEGLLEEVGVLAVAETDGKSLSLGLALRYVGGCVPDPTAVRANVGRELHVRDNCSHFVSATSSQAAPGLCLTVVVGANLERLVSAHNKTSPAVLLVLEKSDLTGSALLPLSAVTVETEELGAHLEGGLLGLLVGPGVDFLGKVDDGLEVYVYLLLGVIILLRTWSVLIVSVVVLV